MSGIRFSTRRSFVCQTTRSALLLLVPVALGTGASCARNYASSTTRPVLRVSTDSTATNKPQKSVRSTLATTITCFWTKQDRPGQRRETVAELVNRLSETSDLTYICEDLCEGGPGCGSPLFWRIVQEGEAAIPFLVEKLDDTTPTHATIPNFGGKYTVADVSMVALEEIVADLPYKQLVHVAPSKVCGECSWWSYVRASLQNRRTVKNRLQAWLASQNLTWTASSSLTSLDCVTHCNHPAGGRFVASPK